MKHALILALFLASSSANAEKAFDGMNAQINLGVGSITNDNQWTGFYKPADKSLMGNVSLGYSKSFNKNFNLSVGAFHLFGSEDGGYGSSAVTDALKVKNVFGLFVEPGYYFSDDTLMYAKLGYAQADSEYKAETNVNYGRSNGFLYGAGFKQKISNSVYVGLEAYQIDFDRSSTKYDPIHSTDTYNKPAITFGGITLGYNFNNNAYIQDSFSKSKFDGVFVQAGLGSASLTSLTEWTNTYKDGDKHVMTNFAAGYSKSFSNQLNIAANVFGVFGSDKAGIYNSSEQMRIKDIWGVSIEPGYNFSENTLAYFKLGWARANSSYEDRYTKINYGKSNGFLYGAGFKQSLTDSLFLGLEAYQIDFSNSKNTYDEAWDAYSKNKPSVTYAGIMAGYTF